MTNTVPLTEAEEKAIEHAFEATGKALDHLFSVMPYFHTSHVVTNLIWNDLQKATSMLNRSRDAMNSMRYDEVDSLLHMIDLRRQFATEQEILRPPFIKTPEDE